MVFAEVILPMSTEVLAEKLSSALKTAVEKRFMPFCSKNGNECLECMRGRRSQRPCASGYCQRGIVVL